MQYVQIQDKKFNSLRAFFWPIYAHELKKIIPMFALFFLISFVYHLLRCLKIAVAIKAPGSGAEIIPFLKVWFVLPAAFIFSFIYAKLAKKYDRVTVFNRCLSIFVIFFIIFTFILFPCREQLELNFLEHFLESFIKNLLPPCLHGFVAGLHGLTLTFKYWPLSLFYVFAEMWSIMVLSVLFWAFCNEITKVNEAKRFYAFIALGANCAAIFSGETVRRLSLTTTYSWIPYGSTAAEQTVFLFMMTAIVLSILIIGLFYWLNQQPFVKSNGANTICMNGSTNYSELVSPEKQKTSKLNLSWKEKLSFLTKTPELGYLTLIVLAYNVVANLADTVWCYQLDIRFTDSAQLVENLGKLDMMIGFTTVTFALFGFSNVIRKFGWKTAAITTPIIWGITTAIAFTALSMEGNIVHSGLFFFFHFPLHELIINVFMLQMCLGKATKYTFFDQSKEIAFIPLTPSQQRNGKAVIDGITSRFGKSGSSIFVQVLLLIFSGEIARIIPYVGAMIFGMLLVWLYATNKLSKVLDTKIYKETVNTEAVDTTFQVESAPLLTSKVTV